MTVPRLTREETRAFYLLNRLERLPQVFNDLDVDHHHRLEELIQQATHVTRWRLPDNTLAYTITPAGRTYLAELRSKRAGQSSNPVVA